MFFHAICTLLYTFYTAKCQFGWAFNPSNPMATCGRINTLQTTDSKLLVYCALHKTTSFDTSFEACLGQSQHQLARSTERALQDRIAHITKVIRAHRKVIVKAKSHCWRVTWPVPWNIIHRIKRVFDASINHTIYA